MAEGNVIGAVLVSISKNIQQLCNNCIKRIEICLKTGSKEFSLQIPDTETIHMLGTGREVQLKEIKESLNGKTFRFLHIFR